MFSCTIHRTVAIMSNSCAVARCRARTHVREAEVVANGEREGDGPGARDVRVGRVAVLSQVFHEPLVQRAAPQHVADCGSF